MDSSRFAPPADVDAAMGGHIPDSHTGAGLGAVPQNSQAGLQAWMELAESASHLCRHDPVGLAAGLDVEGG